MRITVESTNLMVRVKHNPTDADDAAIECRVWEGETDNGIPVCCLIPRIAVNVAHDQSEFERDLKKASPPSTFSEVFPLRMVI